MSLYAVTWACMQLHDLACSSLSLHAVPFVVWAAHKNFAVLVLSYLLELVLVLPGLSEAGNGFSVLISSAFNIDVPPGLARGIRPGAGGGPGAGQGRSSCFEAGLCPPPSCLWQQALQVPMIKQPANKILVNCYWALKLIDLLLTFSPINNHVMFIFKVLEESLSYYQ